MKSGVQFLGSDRCLVTWLRDELLRTVPGSTTSGRKIDLERVWVVLPTRRLAGVLNASLAAAVRESSAGPGNTSNRKTGSSAGALLTPRTMNFDDFLGLLPLMNPESRTDTRAARTLAADLPELLLHSLIARMQKHSKLLHIGPEHSHEIAHLISTTLDQGKELADIVPATLKVLRDEIYRSDDQICAMAARLESLQIVISEFESVLRASGSETAEMRRRFLAGAAAGQNGVTVESAHQDAVEMPWDHLVIAGFTSMAAPQIPLLKQLASRSDVTIALTAPSAHWKNPDAPIERLARAMGWQGNKESAKSVANTDKGPDLPTGTTAEIATFIAPSRELEAEFALRRSLELSATRDGPVAILLPDESTYEPWFRKRFEQDPDLARHFNLAPPAPLSESRLGSWFVHLANFAQLDPFECSDDVRQTAAAFLTHPLQKWSDSAESAADPDTGIVARSCLTQALAAAPDVASIPKRLRAMKNTPLAAIARATEIVDQALGMAEKIRTQTSSATIALLETELNAKSEIFVQNVGAGGVDTDSNRLSAENSPVEALRKILFDLSLTNSIVDTEPGALLEMLVRKIGGSGIRRRGEPLTGVQILTLAEARHFPFATALIVGCNEGTFPRALPKDRLLDQYLLRRLGLPTWNELEAIEDTTFNLLRERLPEIILTCSTRDSERPLIPSRYIEMLRSLDGIEPRKIPPVVDMTPTVKSSIVEPGSTPERKPTHEPAAIMTPEVALTDDARNLSASRLGTWIECPYHYALNAQGAQPADDFENLRRARLGNWLHDSIQAAFDGFFAGFDKPLRPDVVRQSLYERLCQASDRLVPEDFRTSDIVVHLKRWSWLRLVEFFDQLWRHGLPERSGPLDNDNVVTKNPSTNPSIYGPKECHSELDFTGEFGATAGKEFNRTFSGSIDHFEHLGQAWLLLDFKTTSSPRRSEIAKGLRPQLAVYASALSRSRSLDLNHCIAGHFEILKGTWVPGFIGAAAREHAIRCGLIAAKDRTLNPEDAIKAAVGLMTWRIREAGCQANSGADSGTDSGTGSENVQAESPVHPIHAPDTSQCGWCPNNNICRKDDVHYQEWFGSPDKARRLKKTIEQSKRRSG